MSKQTRLQWGYEWGVWWVCVALSLFLVYQLSRPLWDADTLIADKKQACEQAGMAMAKEEVKFGTNYYCKEQPHE